MSVDISLLQSLNPIRALNERPNADALLELKMLVELGKGSKTGIEDLLGKGNADALAAMIQNELLYVRAAMSILHNVPQIRDRLGGETYENLAKLTKIIKQHADKKWVDQCLDKLIIPGSGGTGGIVEAQPFTSIPAFKKAFSAQIDGNVGYRRVQAGLADALFKV